jgi:hypothetical protein
MLRSAFIFGIVASTAFNATAQSTQQSTKLRLLCEGTQETRKLLDVTNSDREAVTFQVAIDLASGAFETQGLSLFTSMAEPPIPKVFLVNEEQFYFKAESSGPHASFLTKLTIDRYSGVARLAQTMTPNSAPANTLIVSGEYPCKRLDQPKF